MVTITGDSALEARLQELAAKVSRPANLSVGFLENSTYPDGTSVPMVAAIQEFGAPKAGIPPRPFFRNMIAAKSPGWADALAELLKQNDFDATKAMARMGSGIKDDLQASIIETTEPPLSQLTLAIRVWRSKNPDSPVTGKIVGELAAKVADGTAKTSGASTKPLVYSGDMLQSVAYTVE